jgi:hypothetical protein
MRTFIIQEITKGGFMLRLLILVFILTSCSSDERTKYQAFKKNKGGGYQERSVDENLKIVRFKANSNTNKQVALRFAKFRAIELCHAQNFMLTHFLITLDKTLLKTVTKTSSTGYPVYYYGMSPYYTRYSGFGYGFGFSSANSTSWGETIQYPNVEVVYECANAVYGPQVAFREVPAEDMKHLVKDLKGGLQIEKFIKDSPNTKDLMVGDILIRANGLRIQHIYQILSLFHTGLDHKLKVDVLRNGNIKSGIILVGTDVSARILETQKKILKSACKYKELKDKALCK